MLHSKIDDTTNTTNLMSSRPSLTPWLADFCLSQIATPTATSSPPPPPKLVQILSRGGSFWTNNNIRTSSAQPTKNNQDNHNTSNNNNNGIRTGKFDARVVVTDGHHSVVAHLSMACQDLLLRTEALHSTPPGSDPWILFQRGSVGLIHSYQLHTTTTTTGRAPTTTATTAPSTAIYNNNNTNHIHEKSLSLIVDRWDCQPELHGMVVRDNSTSSMIQPVLEHIPIRRALLMISTTSGGGTGGNDKEPDKGNRGNASSSRNSNNEEKEEEEEEEELIENYQEHIGDPMEVLQNPQLLQELMELAAVHSSNGSVSTTSSSSSHSTGGVIRGIQSSDNDRETNHATTKLQFQEDLDDSDTSEDDDDDTDDAPVKNLKDMFSMGEDDETNDEGDDNDAEFTQPLQSQPEVPDRNTADDDDDDDDAMLAAYSTDDTHLPLTQPSLSVHCASAGPPRMVDSSTQTMASTLKSQILTLRLCTPAAPSLPHPTALTEREITTPTSNHSHQKSPRQRAAAMDARTPGTLGGVSTASSTQSSSSRSKRRRLLETPPNESRSIPHSTTTLATGTASSVASASSRIRRSYWEQVCEQLDQHAEDARDVLISVDVDSRSRDLLRQGGLSRWLHTNVVTMEDDPTPSPHLHSGSRHPTPPTWVRPPSSMGRTAIQFR
jgi:hypothetical protein